MRTAIFAAIAAATISAPALAQSDEAAFTGPRLGVTSGYDKMQDQDGVSYGVSAGYDLAVAPKIRAGAEVALADSTTNFGTTDASRDISASARVGYVVNPKVMAFGKVGYTSSRFEDTATRLGAAQEGVRYGGGVEVAPTQRTYVSAEYQRTEYGSGLGGRDAALVGVGLRF